MTGKTRLKRGLGKWRGTQTELPAHTTQPRASSVSSNTVGFTVSKPQVPKMLGYLQLALKTLCSPCSLVSKNTVWTCYRLTRLSMKKYCMRAKSHQSCPTLCNPMDCSPPGSSVHGILQQRILEWVATPFSRGSFWPTDRTHHLSHLLHWQASSLPLAPSGKPHEEILISVKGTEFTKQVSINYHLIPTPDLTTSSSSRTNAAVGIRQLSGFSWKMSLPRQDNPWEQANRTREKPLPPLADEWWENEPRWHWMKATATQGLSGEETHPSGLTASQLLAATELLHKTKVNNVHSHICQWCLRCR